MAKMKIGSPYLYDDHDEIVGVKNPDGTDGFFSGIGQFVNVANYGAVGDGVADDTAAIQRALDTKVYQVFVPAGYYKITSTLFVHANQTLFGVNRQNLNASSGSGSVFNFRPTSTPDTCVLNHSDGNSQGVSDIEINMINAGDFGIAFSSSYANMIRRIGFSGTFSVGAYLDSTYVCDIRDLSFNGATVARYCVYVGDTNATTLHRIHTSTAVQNAAVAMCGIGVKGGSGNTIQDCILQGPTIGISLYNPQGTSIINPYFENTVCNIRIGDAAGSPAYNTNIFGGAFSACNSGHSQYAIRGALIYLANAGATYMGGPSFGSSSVSDASTKPIVCTQYTYGLSINSAHFYSSNLRTELFRETAGANAWISAIGETYGSYGATEIILKDDLAYGSGSYGIRVDNTGTLSTTAWSPTVLGATVNSILSSAFYIPTVP